MTLDEIIEKWNREADIHESELAENSMRQAKMHSDWLGIRTKENLTLLKLEEDYKKLYKLKYMYYSGTLSEEELKEKNWEPQRLKILNKDLDMHISADEEISTLKLKIGLAKEKVEALDSIIKMIMNRNFAVNTALASLKFRAGEY